MYDKFYNFSAIPFELAPDSHFYFESSANRTAMSYLCYGLAQGEGSVVITGDTGIGKTILVDHFLTTIDPGHVRAEKLSVMPKNNDALLAIVARAYGLAWENADEGELRKRIEQFLREESRANRRVILIVDDAHNLSAFALEKLCDLLSVRLSGRPLLQIFLLGHPEFRRTLLRSRSLEQFRQRVIATYHIDEMDTEEIGAYITHRLQKVGWQGNPEFSPEVFALFYDESEGRPRLLNALVHRVLSYAANRQLNRIGAKDVQAAMDKYPEDMDDVVEVSPPPPPPPVKAELPPPVRVARPPEPPPPPVRIVPPPAPPVRVAPPPPAPPVRVVPPPPAPPVRVVPPPPAPSMRVVPPPPAPPVKAESPPPPVRVAPPPPAPSMRVVPPPPEPPVKAEPPPPPAPPVRGAAAARAACEG